MKFIVPLNEKQKGVAHKPAQLFQFNKKNYNQNFSLAFDFQ
jgi:8-oxo-dGTP diphosphatase